MAAQVATHGDRLFVDAVIFRARTGIQWRDLPERFGNWKSIYNRFRNWAAKDVGVQVFRELQIDVDETASIADGTVIRAHQDRLRFERFRAELKARGIKAVISSKPERARAIPKDRKLYRKRYLVELFFHSLKRFRGIATRFDKTRASYLALVDVACIWLWLS